MSKKYLVDQWLNHEALKGATNPRKTVEMTLSQMLKTDAEKIGFEQITVGDYVIFAHEVGTENLADVAKHIIEPLEQGKLIHPLGAYICALNDNSLSNELESVVQWVNDNLIMYALDPKHSLLYLLIENRAKHTLDKIKESGNTLMFNFASNTFNIDHLCNIYEHSTIFCESESKSSLTANTVQSLFQLKDAGDDAFLVTDVEDIEYWVKK